MRRAKRYLDADYVRAQYGSDDGADDDATIRDIGWEYAPEERGGAAAGEWPLPADDEAGQHGAVGRRVEYCNSSIGLTARARVHIAGEG